MVKEAVVVVNVSSVCVCVCVCEKESEGAGGAGRGGAHMGCGAAGRRARVSGKACKAWLGGGRRAERDSWAADWVRQHPLPSTADSPPTSDAALPLPAPPALALPVQRP
jgi:hypothetical protein